MVGAWLALSLVLGCGSPVETHLDDPAVQAPTAAPPVPVERLDATWPVRMATEADFGPYAAKEGWVTLVMKRDYRRAAELLGAAGGLPAARAHAELAAVMRQAALLSARSLVEAYGETPEPTDPVGKAHLLTVSYAILGDLEAARRHSAALDGVADDPTLRWHAPWKAWLAGEATWPPDLTGLPLELPQPAPGRLPSIPPPPHYHLPEQGVDTVRDMADPGALLALALWHDQAAWAAAGDAWPLVRAYRAGYQLPVETVPRPPGELPMDLLFGSDLLVPGDAAFLADLTGERGLAAVETHADTSLLAALAAASRVDGKLDGDRLGEHLGWLRDTLVERAAARTGGQVQAHHRQFADIAWVGSLRLMALVADAEGQRELGGRLRLQALERSDKATACPVGMLALGAWDAGNRYPTRALEILHAQARTYPALEAARYGLDVMALRVSRERTGETPGM